MILSRPLIVSLVWTVATAAAVSPFEELSADYSHMRPFSTNRMSVLELPPEYTKAYQSEAQNWVSNVSTDPFYKTPESWQVIKQPGAILRIEEADLRQYTIPRGAGLRLYRLLYQSLDHEDKIVPASAYILVPYSTSPSTPPRVLVWAHGTAGIERQCAPSNQRDLYYNWDAPLAMVMRGYIVIAPDYAGLGSDTTFHYVASPNHAADIAYAVIATRAAFPPHSLSHEWVVVGHSEGGLAAWASNERELTNPTGGFLGAVAIAPALQDLSLIRYGLKHGGLKGSLFYSSYTLIVIARMITSVDVTKYFSPLGMERAQLAATACYDTARALYANLTFSDIFKDESWVDSSWATEWAEKTWIAGGKPLAGPVLLIQGLADMAVFPHVTSEIFQRHCSLQPNVQVHLSQYPHMSHDGVMYPSQQEVFAWIEDRFNGVRVSNGCINSTIHVLS